MYVGRTRGDSTLTTKLTDIICLDTEASGLHPTSYPIELGWCRLDLTPEAHLIRPESDWSEDDWNYDSEKIHGIPRDTLLAEGKPAREVFERLQAVRGASGILVSDNPYFEAMWMTRLCDSLGEECPPFYSYHEVVASIIDQVSLSRSQVVDLQETISVIYPHIHRAGEDALAMAANLKALTNLDFRLSLAA